MRRRNGAGARGNVRVLLLLRALLLLLVLPYFPKKVSADPSCSKECAHAGVCEGKDGTCFMAPDYAVDGWATEGGCEAGGSAWCGDSLGKRLCAARMPRDNYDGIALPDARGELNENCKECTKRIKNGPCINTKAEEMGTARDGTTKSSQRFGVWCKDGLAGGCKVACLLNGACQSASIFCGQNNDCQVTCGTLVSIGLTSNHCSNLFVDGSTHANLVVKCYKNDGACENLAVKCPAAPHTCKIMCYGASDPDSCANVGNLNTGVTTGCAAAGGSWNQNDMTDSKGISWRQWSCEHSSGSGGNASPAPVSGGGDGDSSPAPSASPSLSPGSIILSSGGGGGGQRGVDGTSTQTVLLEGDVLTPGELTVRSAMTGGTFELSCRAASPLFVAPAETVKAGTPFTTRNLTFVRTITGPQTTTKFFRIYVRAEADQQNDDPPLRAARVECGLFRLRTEGGSGTYASGNGRVLVARSSIELKVRNCVRPLFRNASLKLGEKSSSDSGSSFSSVITARGVMEAVVSGGAGAQLRLQAPESVTGRTFSATDLRAFAVSRKGSSLHDFQIYTELDVVSVSQEGREAVLSLPALEDVFAAHKTATGASEGDHLAEVSPCDDPCGPCLLSLLLQNPDVMPAAALEDLEERSAGGTFQCAPSPDGSLRVEGMLLCFQGERSSFDGGSQALYAATGVPNTTNDGSRAAWTLNFMAPCPADMLQPGDPGCSVPRTAPKCGFRNPTVAAGGAASADTCISPCTPCLAGGICSGRGGVPIRSFPGFFRTFDADHGFGLVPCDPPARARCAGSEPVLPGDTQCGVGYLQGSHMCGRCASGFFHDGLLGGVCSECPRVDGKEEYAQLAADVIPFALVLLLALLLMLVSIYALERKRIMKRRFSKAKKVRELWRKINRLSSSRAAAGPGGHHRGTSSALSGISSVPDINDIARESVLTRVQATLEGKATLDDAQHTLDAVDDYDSDDPLGLRRLPCYWRGALLCDIEALKIAARQTKEFGIWMILSAQTVATTSSSPSFEPYQDQAFAWVREVYTKVQFFNLDTSFSTQPECFNKPFQMPLALLAFVLALTSLQYGVFLVAIMAKWACGGSGGTGGFCQRSTARGENRGGKMPLACAFFQGKIFLIMSLSFPLVCKQVFELVHCRGGQIRGATCWEGEHAAMVVLAAVVTCVYVILFPVSTACYLHYRIIPAVLRRIELNAARLRKRINDFRHRQRQRRRARTASRDAGSDEDGMAAGLATTGGNAGSSAREASEMEQGEEEEEEEEDEILLEDVEGYDFRDEDAMTAVATALRCEDGTQRRGPALSSKAMTEASHGAVVGVGMGWSQRKANASAINIAKSKARWARWDHFIHDDYQPRYFWFRHIYYLLSLCIMLTYEFVLVGPERSVIIIVLLTTYGTMLVYFRPFNERDRWKIYVRGAMLTASMLVATLDVCHWAEGNEEASQASSSESASGSWSLPSSSPSSSTSSAASSGGVRASSAVSWLFLCNIMLLPLLLPLSFFIVNYGMCERRLQRFCGCCPCGVRSSRLKGHAKQRYLKKRRLFSHGENGGDDRSAAAAAAAASPSLRAASGTVELEMSTYNPYGAVEDDAFVVLTESVGETDPDWGRFMDAATGCYYLYNAATGETKWEDFEENDPDLGDGGEEAEWQPKPLRHLESMRSVLSNDTTLSLGSSVPDPLYQLKRRQIVQRARSIAESGNSHTVMGWVEVVEDRTEENAGEALATVYVHLASGQVSYERPSGWVRAAAKMYNQRQARQES